MQHIHHQDVKKRTTLRSLFTDMETVLQKVMNDEGLRSQLETEGVTTNVNYRSTILKFQDSLSQEHCPIVLAGVYGNTDFDLLYVYS